ncbi:MAG: AAA family ATPase [Candidatus Zixiibacteriota bacterium]|nr:MAG: AAA family ATPase [candidate division Zixibacteria bacterium]
MSDLSKYRVPVERLRWSCKKGAKAVCGTDDSKATGEIIGQERAIDAIKLGLNVDQPGYNVFVVGYAGTGRSTAIQKMLEELGLKKGEPPEDICYVNNFKDPDCPRALFFPAGKGVKFRDEMNKAIDSLQESITQVKESDDLRARHKAIIEKFEEKQKEMLKAFEAEVNERQFAMTQVQVGPNVRPDVAPVIGGKPVSMGELEARTEAGEFPLERFEELKKIYDELSEKIVKIFKQTRENHKVLKDIVDKLVKNAVEPVVSDVISGLKEAFKIEAVSEHLDEVHNEIINNLDKFDQDDEEQQPQIRGRRRAPRDQFLEYRVNLIVDNSKAKGKPIITEINPNYGNLFGTIERTVDQRGFWSTNFMHIKAGALHRANGGYIILDVMDVLSEAGVWQGLKRAMHSGKLEIQAYDPFFKASHSALKPEPIDLNTQVIMIGMPYFYYLLYELDPDFPKIFKIKAEFDTVMELNDANLKKYGSFARKIVDDFELLPFDQDGMSAVIEYGVRLAGNQKKLSTRFNALTDVMCESSFWAQKAKSKKVTRKHVQKAVDEWIRRVSMPEDKINELIEDGTILIDTDGAVVGQINGLSVYMLGEYAFGKPTRITARTSVGMKGIINVEKEAQLSGATHSKGVLIINGYLQGKFAQKRPLSMNANLCFEQSYGGVDGDSASSTEIYAILSSLGEIPIRQDIAVTGSVNQNGTIQAIGGVNQKIEGFFQVCKIKGLTGKQGVMIPKANVNDLMLRLEVVEAVKNGKFHIYSVYSIEQGIEILTGMPAGKQKKDGSYPGGTIFHLVEEKLDSYAEAYSRYMRPGAGE